MNHKIVKRIIAGILAILIFTGSYATTVCATDSNDIVEDDKPTVAQMDNSIAMVNYLTSMVQEINTSSNSRLYLEDAYSMLINNITLSLIDKRTKRQLESMMETIEKYRMVDVKRDRLKYIYDQNQAQAIRNAIPDPLGLLASVQSFNLRGLVSSVVYMAIDSKRSYESTHTQADLQYIQGGWELDNEASSALAESRQQLFGYRVDMVSKYGIDDKYILNENAVEEFVKCKNNDNVARQIKFLSSGKNKKRYEKFGDYWLVRAKAYYDDGNNEECLNSVDTYIDMNIGIFQNDYGLAEIMPLAIAAAEDNLKGKDREKKIREYVGILENNTEPKNWALCYFAAQTYLELYTMSNNEEDLNKAYEIVTANVNYLIDEQSLMNNTYLSPIVKKKNPKNATQAQKNDVKEYNKMIENERKVELPPVSEALYLNCDLLFALADKLNISSGDKEDIEEMLHDGKALFLTKPLDETYSFTKEGDAAKYDIGYDKGELVLPASILSERSLITVTIVDGENTTTVDDWKISKVKRGNDADITTFQAVYKSDISKKYEYKNGNQIKISVIPVDGSSCKEITADFKANEESTWIFTSIEFERIK